MKFLLNFLESKCNSGDPVCEIGCEFRLLAKYGVVSSRMRATLANVDDVPVDIRSYLRTNILINSSIYIVQAHLPEGLLVMERAL